MRARRARIVRRRTQGAAPGHRVLGPRRRDGRAAEGRRLLVVHAAGALGRTAFPRRAAACEHGEGGSRRALRRPAGAPRAQGSDEARDGARVRAERLPRPPPYEPRRHGDRHRDRLRGAEHDPDAGDTQVRQVLPFALALLCAPTLAQNFPAKPIKIILPAVAGSAPDLRVRQVAPKVGDALGQPLIVDNRPGANGAIGAREAAKAAPDGYTLFNANINNALNDLLAPDPSCRLNHELVAVTDLALAPLIMVVNPNVPANTLAEYIALAKSKPKGLTYASGGSGSVIQLLAERIKDRKST